MLEPAFFVPDGDAFVATEHTRGPWSAEYEHGGPPAALLARSAARRAPGMQVARVTVDFLRPVPIGRLAIRESLLRPGKKVTILGASLWSGEEEVARASVLCMRTTKLDLPVPKLPAHRPPEDCPPVEMTFFRHAIAYHHAMEMRAARGTWGRGDMAAWLRMRVPLILGEEPSALDRVMVASDSGHGVSLLLDPRSWTFINPDLTVVLHRPARGEWVCLDSVTVPQPNGIGMADTALYDVEGSIGRVAQCLIIERSSFDISDARAGRRSGE